ncbi:GAP1-N1 domain-containing protein [Croceicoccus mobilis]|nr:hypothetical protein [Croceicoccus mobilis]
MILELEQTVHGYRRGHELLAGGKGLPKADLTELLRLSDLSGSMIEPKFDDYLTLYPLPSRSHYCIARTWQDVDAPRRGCVFTHSILVPMDDWADGLSAFAVAALHRRPSNANLASFEAATPPIELGPNAANSYASKSGGPPEGPLHDFIVKYYEKQKIPIVWPFIDAAWTDDLLLRVADLGHGPLRSRFAGCSYALQSKATAERVFDLMLVPRKAMGRFSEVSPSNIVDNTATVGASVENAAQFGGSYGLAEALLNGSPDLTQLIREAGGTLPASRDTIVKLVRISEMREMSKNASSGILAELDLWNAIAPTADVAIKAKRSALLEAWSRLKELEPDDRMNFLMSVLQRAMRPSMRQAYAETRPNWVGSVSISAEETSDGVALLAERRNAPAPFVALVAKSLVKDLRITSETLPALAVIDRRTARRMIAHQPTLPKIILDAADATSQGRAFADRVSSWLNDGMAGRARRAKIHLLGSRWILLHDDLAKTVLTDLEETDVHTLLETVARNPTSYSIPIRKLLADCVKRARKKAAAHYVREGLRHHEELALAEMSASGFEEVLKILDRTRDIGDAELAVDFLRGFLQSSKLVPTQSEADRMFDLLVADPASDDEILSGLARRVSARKVGAVKVITPRLVETRKTLARRRFEFVLRSRFEKGMVDAKFSEAVAELARDGAVDRRLVDAMIDRMLSIAADGKPRKLWSSTKILLQGLPPRTFEIAPDLLLQLAGRTAKSFDDEIVALWLDILGITKERSPARWKSLAIASLVLAERERKAPMGPIVAATFAPYYASLPKGRKSNWLLDPFGFFEVPDRRKEAAGQIIEWFHDSTWSPAFLALAASNAGILEKVLKIARSQKRHTLIDRMRNDLRQRRMKMLDLRVTDFVET